MASVVVRPWDAAWPWNPKWVAREETDKCTRSLTLGWDETLTVRNSGWYLHEKDLSPDIDVKEWDETSKRVVAHYHAQKVKNAAELCGARDLFLHMFGGPKRLAVIRDLLEWAYANGVRLRICNRGAIEEIMAALTAVDLDPRLFYEIHAKRAHDSGHWFYWARGNDTGLLQPAFEVAYEQRRIQRVRAKEATASKSAGGGSDAPPLSLSGGSDSSATPSSPGDPATAQPKTGAEQKDDRPERYNHADKTEVMCEIRAADLSTIPTSLFADNDVFHCKAAKGVGHLVVPASDGGLTEQEVADIKAILVAGCYPPHIIEARKKDEEAAAVRRAAESVRYKAERDEYERTRPERDAKALAEAAKLKSECNESDRAYRLAVQQEVRLAMEERKRLKQSLGFLLTNETSPAFFCPSIL